MRSAIAFLSASVRANAAVENVRAANSTLKSDRDISINSLYIPKVSAAYLLFLECFNLTGGNCC
ncbi:Uncharacterised protein [Vibrio cholerae]|nr:Uncharacterised protein [Vibrio cholerae]CSC35815.1 Uncharacterised protein [Vibrio cholerae]CSC53905.1 Uncharacterised protein [Vibrio cholerae]